MTDAVVRAGRRYLPRGWTDLGRQLLIWFGFLLVYQLVRGLADRSPAEAFHNGLRVISFESNANALYELTFQRLASQSHWLSAAVSWTYWNSEFTVVGLALLWVYVRRHDYFYRFRNWILLANVFGLVGYIFLPTAPPRMFPSFGFIDSHRDGVVQLAANPYAAMPSLHAADALIVGITLALICKRSIFKVFWAIWPVWVWFSVMATGNHFWLDVLAGFLVAILAGVVIYRVPLRRRVFARA
jgi:membrane-associated phospholipid phosphatase